MADIVVFGAGQIAEVAKVYIDAHSEDRIVGFTVDAAFAKSDSFAGLPLVPWEKLETRFPPDKVKLLGPLSFRRLNELRRDRYLEGKSRSYEFTSFIHPDCRIYSRDIGENCFILEGNTIQPFARIGNDVIMWSGNHIGHHSVIGDHCFLASHIAIGGGAQVGEECFIGGMSGVDPGVIIGPRCFIKAGAIVRKNLPAESVVLPEADPIARYPSSHMKAMI